MSDLRVPVPRTQEEALVTAANAFADLCREAARWLAADRDLRTRRDGRLSSERPGRGRQR
jgi:hypothetical protein